VLLDKSGQPVGGLAGGFSVTLSGTTYPAFVQVDMLATAAKASHRIRVLRKQGLITGPDDPDADVADFPCDDGGGGISAICDAESAASPIDGGSGFLREPDFSTVIPFPPVPSLGAAAMALLAAGLAGSGIARLATGRGASTRA
jgi:hypothetical protein